MAGPRKAVNRSVKMTVLCLSLTVVIGTKIGKRRLRKRAMCRERMSVAMTRDPHEASDMFIIGVRWRDEL